VDLHSKEEFMIPKNKESKAQEEVENNEKASLQDESYSFDEDNTGNEEYHDAYEVEDEEDLDDLMNESL